MPTPDLVRSILAARDPGFDERAAQWARDEALYRADPAVKEHLTPFNWERARTATGAGVEHPDLDGYALRKERAEYVPFAQMRAEAVVGPVMQRAAETVKPGAGITFGALGEVRDDPGTAEPTPAELLWNNADGVGRDAQGLMAFVEMSAGLASATDYRYTYVDAPPERPRSRRDEIDGARPYLVDVAPYRVPYAVWEAGALVAVHVLLPERVRAIAADAYTDEEQTRHLLMTRQGFLDWGEDFAGGGWWVFDGDGNPVNGPDGSPRMGTWANTHGQIPMARLIYKRASSGEPTSSGASWLNNMALAHMDAGSWHWNDLRVSGGRKRYWLGADPAQWAQLAAQAANGAVEVPVPARADGTGNVEVYDTGQITVGSALQAYRADIEERVARFFVRELATSPDASGAAKVLEVVAGKSPMLAHLATNVEEWLWTVLRFAEQRWTGVAEPSATVTMPRDFDLRNTVEKLNALLGVFTEAKVSVPPSLAPLFGAAVESTGLVTEGGEVDTDAVVAEVQDALGAPREAARAAAAANVKALTDAGMSLEAALEKAAGLAPDEARRLAQVSTDGIEP